MNVFSVVHIRFSSDDITPTNLTIQDEYRVNSFYAVLDNIVTSIAERFDENHLAIVILCEKLFLTKTILTDDELKEIARFYDVSYGDLRAEQRLYKIALDEKKRI